MARIITHQEFSFMLWEWIPTAYGLYKKNLLEGTESKLGTSPFFYFSPDHKETHRHDWIVSNFSLYYQHDLDRSSEYWVPPPYKEHFKNDVISFDRPLLTIKNKATIEWGQGLYNYLTRDALKDIFKTFYDDYQIIYIVPPQNTTKDFVHDPGVQIFDIGDQQLIDSEFPEVLTIKDLSKLAPNKNYNELQIMALANSDRHISVAGGDAVVSSYFGGDLLIYRHHERPGDTRPVWHTGSYLRKFGGSNVIGVKSYDSLLQEARSLWK